MSSWFSQKSRYTAQILRYFFAKFHNTSTVSNRLNPCFQQMLKEGWDNTLTAFPGIPLTKPVRNVLSSLFTEVNPRPPFYPFSTATPKIKRSKGRSDTISDGGEGLSLTNLFFNTIIIFRYFLLSSFSALIYLFIYLFILIVCLLADLLEGVEVNPERPSKKQSEHHMPSFGK